MSLLACGDDKEDVREEGRKGLTPNDDNPNEGREYPGLVAMTQYIYSRVSLKLYTIHNVSIDEWKIE